MPFTGGDVIPLPSRLFRMYFALALDSSLIVTFLILLSATNLSFLDHTPESNVLPPTFAFWGNLKSLCISCCHTARTFGGRPSSSARRRYPAARSRPGIESAAQGAAAQEAAAQEAAAKEAAAPRAASPAARYPAGHAFPAPHSPAANSPAGQAVH